jgi:hypothetical protein
LVNLQQHKLVYCRFVFCDCVSVFVCMNNCMCDCECHSLLPSVAGGSGGDCRNSSRCNVDRFCVAAGYIAAELHTN